VNPNAASKQMLRDVSRVDEQAASAPSPSSSGGIFRIVATFTESFKLLALVYRPSLVNYLVPD